ncbi:MAG: glycoside hydrolase family 28 protein [Tepidisphaeraceae bacterium]
MTALQVFNVIDHGAKANASHDDGPAINAAIRAASNAGGGRVVVPAGEYCCGPIALLSRVELHLETGALLRFSRSFDDFPLKIADYEGQPAPRCTSPIEADDQRDIAITGAGTIDGSGDAWRPVKRMKRTPQEWDNLLATGGVVEPSGEIWWPTEGAMHGAAVLRALQSRGDAVRLADFAPARDFCRPVMVKLTRCRNVVLDGPTFRNSPAWNIHLLLCDHVVVRKVTVLNDWWAQNGDGIDVESCNDVFIEDSHVDVGDDALCLKSGKDEAGRKRGVATQRVTIERCTVRHGHGGVVIGSEMSGGVHDVRVRDCTFDGTDIGLRFKSTRGRGGVVERVDIANVSMQNITTDAIGLNLFYATKNTASEPVSERTPIFRNLKFRNITCTSSGRPIELRGLPEMPVQDVTIEQSKLVGKRAGVIVDARQVRLSDVRIQTEERPGLQVSSAQQVQMVNVEVTHLDEGELR